MSHLVYIDPDEEIISVIGRLRKTTDTDVFFAVPKRALFLQSFVNLRLLERESKKLGKHLCLVMQDEAGRALAEKAGIESKSSLEGVPGVSPKPTSPPLPARLSRVDQSASPENHAASSNGGPVSLLHSESIGSPSFFAARESAVDVVSSVSTPSPTPPPAGSLPRPIPVRDRTPKQLTMLNSVRDEGSSVPPSSAPVSSAPPKMRYPASLSAQKEMNDRSLAGVTSPAPILSPENAPQVSFTFPAPVTPFSPGASSKVSPRTSQVEEKSSETPIARFYQNRPGAQDAGRNSVLVAETPQSGSHGRKIFYRILFGFVVLSVVAALGVLLVIFVPRADVTVLVKELSMSIDAEILARMDQKNVDVEGKIIPLRLIEVEKDITQSFPGTGQSSVSDKRARGMVTISNAFSGSPQSLVATTRFESPEGKIFRLVKGIVIPGMKEENGQVVPGTVEAEVVADKSGEEYNIAPASFTVPGLKGSPKYEKISALSTKAFIGGGDGSGAVASVSADDVIRAKEAFEKKLPELLRAELEKDLQPGEKLLEDAVLSQILSSGAFPGVGAVASSFDFRSRVSVRALVFSESDMRAVSAALAGDGATPENITVEYTVPRPDFTAKSMEVKARISLLKSQGLDIDGVKKSILGKSVGDVQNIFADYPDIQKIEVVFWPKFMTSRIPSRASQVKVHVETVTNGT